MNSENSLNVTFVSADQNNPADIAELSQFATAILKQHFDPIVGEEQNDYMLSMFQSEHSLKEQISHGYRYYWVKEQGKNAGFIAFYPRNGKMYLSKFYLHKDYRGKKLGKKMLAFVEQEAKKEQLPAVFLNVNKENFDVIEIYKHMGFFISGKEKNDIGNGYFMDDYIMEYPIEKSKA